MVIEFFYQLAFASVYLLLIFFLEKSIGVKERVIRIGVSVVAIAVTLFVIYPILGAQVIDADIRAWLDTDNNWFIVGCYNVLSVFIWSMVYFIKTIGLHLIKWFRRKRRAKNINQELVKNGMMQFKNYIEGVRTEVGNCVVALSFDEQGATGYTYRVYRGGALLAEKLDFQSAVQKIMEEHSWKKTRIKARVFRDHE